MTTKTLASSLAALAASSMLAVQGAVEPVWPDKPVGDLTTVNAVGFENFTAGFTPAAGFTDDGQADPMASYFYYVGTSGDDQSVVTNHAVGTTFPSSVPNYFSGLENDLYLSLSTEGGTLFRSLNVIDSSGEQAAAGTPVQITSAGLFVDTLVQFTPCEDVPSVDAENKLAIWLNVVTNSAGEPVGTNLCVKAGYWVMENEALVKLSGGATYTLANTSEISIEAGEWVRLTVKAIQNVYSSATIGEMPAFQVYINDTLAVFNEDVGTSDALTQIGTLEATALTALQTKSVLPSMQDVAALQAVGFQGTGAVDDFVVTTEDPYAVPVNFTLFWDTNITALETYLNGSETPTVLTDVSGNHVFDGLGDGDTIEIELPSALSSTTVAEGYEIDWANSSLTNVTMAPLSYQGDVYAYEVTLVGAGPYSVSLVTKSVTPPATPFDGGQGLSDDPYIVRSKKAFDELRTRVAEGETFSGTYFALDGDVDFEALGLNPFPGIGTYNANPSLSVPFSGTFDGAGYKIMNVDFTQRNYAGIFNEVNGGTIKNLTVSNITCNTFDQSVNAGEWACAIIGQAAWGTTLQNLVSEGDFGTELAPCTHNVAGIVIRAEISSENGNVSLIDCTNKASIVGQYTKVAGILGLCAGDTGTLSFTRCVNLGSVKKLSSAKNGDGGVSGIAAYLSYNGGVTFDSCESLGPVTTDVADYCQLGTMIGYNAKPVTLLGVNIARGDTKSVGQPIVKSSNPGTPNGPANAYDLAFATVSGGIATFAVPAFDGTVYNSMAVTATNFVLAAVGDELSIDSSIAEHTGTVTTSVADSYIVTATSGSVTTYTVAAKIDASDAVLALSSTSANWGLGLSFPTVSLTLGGDTIDPADYTVEWSTNGVVVSGIIAMEEGDDDIAYTATATITGEKYIAGTQKSATFTVSAPSTTPTVTPGVPTELDASTAEAATNEAASITIVVADAEADAEGQTNVLKKVIGYNESTGKYFVTAEIDEEKIVDPDTTIADVATNLAAVASAAGLRSVNIPRASVTPGLYYSIAMVDDLSTADTAAWTAGEGTRVLAKDADEVVNLPISKPASGTKAFYKIMINMTQKPAPDPEP